jgi:hypothetical protein
MERLRRHTVSHHPILVPQFVAAVPGRKPVLLDDVFRVLVLPHQKIGSEHALGKIIVPRRGGKRFVQHSKLLVKEPGPRVQIAEVVPRADVRRVEFHRALQLRGRPLDGLAALGVGQPERPPYGEIVRRRFERRLPLPHRIGRVVTEVQQASELKPRHGIRRVRLDSRGEDRLALLAIREAIDVRGSVASLLPRLRRARSVAHPLLAVRQRVPVFRRSPPRVAILALDESQNANRVVPPLQFAIQQQHGDRFLALPAKQTRGLFLRAHIACQKP